MEEIIKYLKEHIELCNELENRQSEKKVLQLVLKKVEKEAINYTRCSLQLKSKKAPTFEHWLICNFEETKNGKYIDFNNGEIYIDKQVLKLKYNKIFKPTF